MKITRNHFLFYVGIALWVIILPMNHIDKLFPVFTSFSFLGNSYQFIEGYTSIDVIWVIIQKLNIIIAGIGTLCMIQQFKKKERFYLPYLLFKYTMLFMSIILLYMAIDALRWYVTDFTWDTSVFMYLVILACCIEFGYLGYYIIGKRSQEAKEKRKMLIAMVDTMQRNLEGITQDVNNLENIPGTIERGEFMEVWDKVARQNARAAYNKIAFNAQQINEIENNL